MKTENVQRLEEALDLVYAIRDSAKPDGPSGNVLARLALQRVGNLVAEVMTELDRADAKSARREGEGHRHKYGPGGVCEINVDPKAPAFYTACGAQKRGKKVAPAEGGGSSP